MTILDKILQTKREEVAVHKRFMPQEILKEMPLAARTPLSMREALEASPCGIIAEFKRKSPSMGFINEQAVVAEVVRGYAANGASACSVLTDFFYFGGTPEDLMVARNAVEIPLLRKDFVIDPYQIFEAKSFGADAVLLIAAALVPAQCEELAEVAHSLGLEVLLEVHNAAECSRIYPGIDMVGVNNRNLATFVTDIYTSFELAKTIPSCHLRVSESGIGSFGTVKALRDCGYRGFLIGERFMREDRPAAALKKFIENAG